MSREPSALEKLRQLELEQQRAASGTAGQPSSSGAGTGGGSPAPPGSLDARLIAPPRSAGAGRKAGKVLGGLGVGALVLWKLKGVLLFALTKLKFLLVGLKFTKFLTTGFTMILAIWTYSLFYGWPFAALLVLLILIHELGHGAAARIVGLQVGAPVFIPFFGAFIALKERPRSTYEDFIIGAGGPIAGSVASALCIALASYVDDHHAGLLRAVGWLSLSINLFNLTPFWSLDGARMLEPVTPKQGLFGLAFLIAVLFFFGSNAQHFNPMAFIVVLVCAFRFVGRWWTARRTAAAGAGAAFGVAGGGSAIDALNQRLDAPVAEASVTPEQRSTAALTYFALAGSLIAAVHVVQRLLPTVAR